MVSSLRGLANAVRTFPNLAPKVAIKYLTSRLSINDMEGITSELYCGEVRIVQVSNPLYASFAKDIDTLRDFRAYQAIIAGR